MSYHRPIQGLDLSASVARVIQAAQPMMEGVGRAMRDLGYVWESARLGTIGDSSHLWHSHITMERRGRTRERHLLEAARYDLRHAFDRGSRKYALDQIRRAAKADARTAVVLGPVKVTGTWAKGGQR